MLTETCPRCRSPLSLSTLAETLRECPKCRGEFQDQKAQKVALLTRSGEDEKPRPRALIALTAEFAAKYRLHRVVGAGAMGTVVEAADVRNGDKTVAVKFLMRLNSAAILERFVREVRALSNLRHPNVLRMLDNGELDGHPYVVTEYLGGGTLRDRLKKQKVQTLSDTVAICAALLRALAACHAQGIVHRDVKPENVLFGEDGLPRLADLGLAKEEGGAELTEDGVALGTPLYMSPEQVQGISVGPGSDIYSIALIMYEMLTGRHPFIAPRLANILDHHLRTMPKPIHELVPGTPEALSAVLTAALIKKREDRTADAAALADRLEQLVQVAETEPTRGALPARPKGDAVGTVKVEFERPDPAGDTAPVAAPARPRSSPSRKEKASPPAEKRPPETTKPARGFVALPLWLRAVVALAPFAVFAALTFVPKGDQPAPSPKPSRSLPAFLVAKSPEPSATPQPSPSASGVPRDASGAGGGGGIPSKAPALVDDEDMVQIPGGTFSMGSSDSFAGDAKAHEVRVRGFWIDRHEVSNARFARFILATGYRTEAEKRGRALVHDGKALVELAGACWDHPRGPEDSIDGKEDRPVVQVSWNDAFAFAVWAKKRLPTEAEWERAARGSARGNFPWGDEPPPGRACVGRRADEGSCPVGGFSTNDFGLRDVLGNVREWCGDWYAADYYVSPSAAENPIGPDSGRSRVIRGGSFLSPIEDVALPARRDAWPNVAALDLGFRTARDSSQ